MPIQILVDDSVGQGPGSFLVLGGLIGSAESWAEFADLWAARLRETPAIHFFKFAHADGCNGQFYGFSEEARDNKLRRLIETIEPFGFQAVSVTVPSTNFSTIFKDLKRFGRGAADPYLWTSMRMIQAALYAARDAGERERFEIIFDENPLHRDRLKLHYSTIRSVLEETEPRAKELLPIDALFRDDAEFVALQAADLWAGFWRHCVTQPDHRFLWLASEFKRTIPSPHSLDLDEEWAKAMLSAAGSSATIPADWPKAAAGMAHYIAKLRAAAEAGDRE